MALITLVEYSPLGSLLPDTSLGYLAAAAKKSGHECQVFHCNPLTWNASAFLDYVGQKKPEVVGFKIGSRFSFKPTLDLAKAAREQSPASLIVAGGPIVTMGGERILDLTNAFDVLVLGEGELALTSLADSVDRKRDFEDVPNIAFTKDGRVVKTEATLVGNLDELPFPDWSIFDLENYLPIFSLTVSRGCPYHCSYCCANHLWRDRLRRRSLSNVLAELDFIREQFGVVRFYVTDPTPDPRFLEAMSDHLCHQGGSTLWCSYAHVAAFRDADFERLARGGCFCLLFGIESGDPPMLARMGRTYSPDEIAPVLRRARACGIRLSAALLCGFPGETKSSVRNTLKLLAEVPVDDWAIDIFHLNPGAPAAAAPAKYTIRLHDEWLEKFLLGEAPYYDIDGVPNDLWETFWSAKWRTLAQDYPLDWATYGSEIQNYGLLSSLFGISPSEFLGKWRESCADRSSTAMRKLLWECWQRSASLARAPSRAACQPGPSSGMASGSQVRPFRDAGYHGLIA